jgi:hypothetical protein
MIGDDQVAESDLARLTRGVEYSDAFDASPAPPI